MKSTSIKMFVLNVGVWNCSPGMLLGKLVDYLSYGASPTRALRARVELRYQRVGRSVISVCEKS